MPRNPARAIAVLLLAQMVLAPIVNFGLLAPLFAPPGILANAAGHAGQVGLAMLLGLLASGFGLAVAIALGPVVRPRSRPLALWLVGIALFGLAIAAAEHIAIQALLATSRAVADGTLAGNVDATVVGLSGLRRGAHYTGLLAGGAFAFTLYLALGLGRQVPRVLAAFGAFAAAIEMFAVAQPLFGGPIVMNLLMPLGLAHLALVVWLLWKGLAEAQPVVVGGA